MNHPHLGSLITGDAERDATHIAVAPVIAAEPFDPGDRIGFVEPGNVFKVGRSAKMKIGVADPFLKKRINTGDCFWMCLDPQTTQQLRHDWSHPSFTAVEVANKLVPNESVEFLQKAADECRVTYEELLDGARDWIKHGTYFGIGTDTPDSVDEPEFWKHFENVTGVPLPSHKETHFVSCAC